MTTVEQSSQPRDEPEIPVETAIGRAVEYVGGQQALAEKIGVRYQAVQKWLRAKRVPAERVLAVEAATKGVVSRHELRPDIYPL